MSDAVLLLWLCVAMALPVGLGVGMLAYWLFEVRERGRR